MQLSPPPEGPLLYMVGDGTSWHAREEQIHVMRKNTAVLGSIKDLLFTWLLEVRRENLHDSYLIDSMNKFELLLARDDKNIVEFITSCRADSYSELMAFIDAFVKANY